MLTINDNIVSHIEPLEFKHTPIMVNEVLHWLKPDHTGVFIDCTVGGGGHAHALLASAKGVYLVGLDQDTEALKAASDRLAPFANRYILVHCNFSNLPQILDELGITQADGFLFDLGVSSYQLDNSHRGFSYMQDAPLDMRMDLSAPVTAKDLVNELPEQELKNIISRYGEERWAARIAAFIVRERARNTINTTGELTEIIKQAIPSRARREGPHPAKRTFQALRIMVNHELDILSNSLHGALEHLKPGKRMCVLTFHSLEDRIVKRTFNELANPCTCPPQLPICVCGKEPQIKILTRHPAVPKEAELQVNHRARSAKLRVVEKI